MPLSNVDIQKAIEANGLKFDPPLDLELQLKPASIDLRLGAKIFKTSPQTEPKTIGEGEYLTIEPQEFVQAMTYERLELSNQLAGRFGVKSGLTRKGLYLFSGLQIDPGWRGHLVVSLFNTSTQPIAIRFKEPFCSIEINRVESPASPAYDGDYQDQTDFDSEDVSWLMRAKGMTFVQVVEAVRDLQNSVKNLDNTVSDLRQSLSGLRTDMRIWLAVIAVIIALASILPRVL